MRRYSTSSMESFVRSAMTLNGMVRSSDGRLQHNKIIKAQIWKGLIIHEQ